MNKNAKKYGHFGTIFGTAAILGALLMVGGCGGGGSSPVATNTTQLTATNATLNASGTLTTTAAVTATTADGATAAITIPSGTIITGSSNFTSLPVSINVSTPVSGTSGMPNPLPASNLVLATTAGAVDVNIGGLNSVTFSGHPVTINIPVSDSTKLTHPIVVDMNKNDGTGWHHLSTPGTLDPTEKFVTITVTNLCWFGADNLYQTPAGVTGSGGTGSGGF